MDDNDLIVDTIGLYIGENEYNVLKFTKENCYKNIMEYIKPLNAYSILAFIDIALNNGENGLILAEKLSKLGIKIIFITGCHRTDPLYLAAQKTNHKVIEKPFKYSLIKELIYESTK